MDFAAFSSQPRGLHNFISEIRNCKTKEDERARVDKELANIRVKFSSPANLSSYDKKKYVWKLCYIYMLGYEVDFGHVEFISLLSSTKFQEKSVGYMAFSMMFRPGDELMTLAVNSMRNDIIGQFSYGQSLALAAVSNMGGNDLAEALSPDVQRLVAPPTDSVSIYATGPNVEIELRNKTLLCKKAAICLLRLFRTNPECVVLEDWTSRLGKLLEDRDLGVITSVMSLLLGFASYSPVNFEPLVPYVISVLNRLVVHRTCPADYLYYHNPSPWLQTKCLRFLQYYKVPEENTQIDMLNDCMSKILIKTDSSESGNKSNADHSVLFEAINLIISYGSDCPAHLKDHASTLLGKFISMKEPNIRYLGIDAMTRLAKLEGPSVAEQYQHDVLDALKDSDVSLRKKALSLLYVMTYERNAHDIVGELVTNLPLADADIKEDIVVKIAILAEKYNSDFKWYVDTMVQVVLLAGDYVSEAVWYRIVQVVTNNQDIHDYTAEKMLGCVQSKFAHETIVAIAAYLLGEIGVNICDRPSMTGYDQFAALHQHFPKVSGKVQSILLTTYVKLLNLYPEQIKDLVLDVFNKYSTSSQLELQQRSCEYLALSRISSSTMENVLNTMPPFPEKENILLAIDSAEAKTADRPAWTVEKPASSGANSEKPSRAHVEVAPVTAKAVTAAVDLLSLDDDFAPSSSSAASSGGLSAAIQEKMKAQLKAAYMTRGLNSKTVLVETDFVSISVASEYHGQQGRMFVFVYNKGNFDLTGFEFSLPTVDGVAFKLAQAPSSRIIAGDEARIAIALMAMKPFKDTSPQAIFSFTVQSSSQKYEVPLPIAVSSFCQTLTLDKPTYMNTWKNITAENTEAQVVFTSGSSVSPQLLDRIRAVMMPALGVGIAEGLDNDKTFTGCTTFMTGTALADGKFATVGALLRLEGDPNQNKFRITVRSTNPVVSQAIKDQIVSLLS